METLSQLRYRPMTCGYAGTFFLELYSLYAITGVPASTKMFVGTQEFFNQRVHIQPQGRDWIPSSHLLLTGEFSLIVAASHQPATLCRERPTTPAHRFVCGSNYYTINICDLQGLILAGALNGDEGDRTPDLNSAIVALSQLSYIPLARCILA
jgi:hypothetical protein